MGKRRRTSAPDPPPSINQLGLWVAAFAQDLAAALPAITAHIGTIVAEAGVAAERIHEAIATAYEADGAIYGHHHDGMLLWLKEKAEIASHQQAIDAILERQETTRAMRRAVESTP